MELVDLFCGGGGSSEGFHNAGFSTVYAVDNAWHARETFKLNHGDVVHNHNIAKLRSEQIFKHIDSNPTIVTASPPCEPFTSANQKRVNDPFLRLFDDKIGRLMIHTIRLISDLQPDYYFIENVRGILDGDGKSLLRNELINRGLGDPYFNWIDATEWGVPSHRTRIIISNLELKIPKIPYRTVRDAIGELPDPAYPNKYRNHETIYLSHKYRHEMVTQKPGQGLVFFYGANTDYQNYIRLDYDKPAPVVMGKSRFVHPIYDRFLTPFEHGRLMTFPDHYKYRGTLEHIYDVIGESIPPIITNEIGNQVRKLL